MPWLPYYHESTIMVASKVQRVVLCSVANIWVNKNYESNEMNEPSSYMVQYCDDFKPIDSTPLPMSLMYLVLYVFFFG